MYFNEEATYNNLLGRSGTNPSSVLGFLASNEYVVTCARVKTTIDEMTAGALASILCFKDSDNRNFLKKFNIKVDFDRCIFGGHGLGASIALIMSSMKKIDSSFSRKFESISCILINPIILPELNTPDVTNKFPFNKFKIKDIKVPIFITSGSFCKKKGEDHGILHGFNYSNTLDFLLKKLKKNNNILSESNDCEFRTSLDYIVKKLKISIGNQDIVTLEHPGDHLFSTITRIGMYSLGPYINAWIKYCSSNDDSFKKAIINSNGNTMTTYQICYNCRIKHINEEPKFKFKWYKNGIIIEDTKKKQQFEYYNVYQINRSTIVNNLHSDKLNEKTKIFIFIMLPIYFLIFSFAIIIIIKTKIRNV